MRVDTVATCVVALAAMLFVAPTSSAEHRGGDVHPTHPLSHITPIDIPFNASQQPITNVSRLQISTGTDSTGLVLNDYRIRDPSNTFVYRLNPVEGEFEYLSAGVNLNGNNISQPNTIKSGGQNITLRDSTNQQDILRAKEGGNLTIPSGDLELNRNVIENVERLDVNNSDNDFLSVQGSYTSTGPQIAHTLRFDDRDLRVWSGDAEQTAIRFDNDTSNVEIPKNLDVGNPTGTGGALDVGGLLNTDGNININGNQIVDNSDGTVGVGGNLEMNQGSISGLPDSFESSDAVDKEYVENNDDNTQNAIDGDLVAGNGLSGGSDDVLPGGDSDVTVNLDADDLDSQGNVEDFSAASDLDSNGDISSFDNANDLDGQGNVEDFSAASNLNSNGQINDFSAASDLNSNGQINDFSAASDLNSNGDISSFDNANDLNSNGNLQSNVVADNEIDDNTVDSSEIQNGANFDFNGEVNAGDGKIIVPTGTNAGL